MTAEELEVLREEHKKKYDELNNLEKLLQGKMTPMIMTKRSELAILNHELTKKERQFAEKQKKLGKLWDR